MISNLHSLFIASIIICSSISLAGQKIERLTDGQFRYNNKVQNFEDLKDVLLSNPNTLTIYNKAIRARRTGRVLAFTGSGVLAGGLALWVTHDPDMYCDLFCVDGAIATLGMLAGSGLLIAAIGPGLAYKKRKHKVVDLYNMGFSDHELSGRYNTFDWKLSLGKTTNGLGVTLEF